MKDAWYFAESVRVRRRRFADDTIGEGKGCVIELGIALAEETSKPP
jgi:hypothetical protein